MALRINNKVMYDGGNKMSRKKDNQTENGNKMER